MDKSQIQAYGKSASQLTELIPNLTRFKKKQGSEGVAYFVGKEFVVKYFERINLEFALFDDYCREIQFFNKQNYAVPMMYSWARVPIVAEDGIYKYYMLQQQIPGEDLYPQRIADISPSCVAFCTREEFDEALKNMQENKALYAKIVEQYTKTILEINEKLVDMPKDKIAHFIDTYIQINKNSKTYYPDLHAGNVLFDGENLTLIDGLMVYRGEKWLTHEGKFNETRFKVDTFYDLLALFVCNNSVRYYFENFQKDTGTSPSFEYKKLANQNQKLISQIIKTWAKEGKRLLLPDDFSRLDIDFLCGVINLNQAEKNKIAQILQK